MDLDAFPKTAIEFEERFATEAACRAYLIETRWPDGFRCPRCAYGEAWELACRPLLECAACGHQVSLTAGTVLQGTRKPLRLWFKAIFLAASHATGISARQLQRHLGLGSYETAWTWLHKIRRAMVRRGRERLTGVVEVNEAYVGGVEEGVSGRETKTKSIVAVGVEVVGDRAGRARLAVITDASGDSLGGFVEANVGAGSVVKTDGWLGYSGLDGRGYVHQPRTTGKPKHASQWLPHSHRAVALLKRWLLGTYQGAVSAKHLSAYLQEYVFRFNRRRSRDVTLPFRRVCEIAMHTPPAPYKALVAPMAA